MLHPFNRCQRVIEFTDTIVVITLTRFGAAEIESQDAEIETGKCPRKRMCHLVVHCSAMLGVRMAHHGIANGHAISRRLDDRLKPSRGSVDEQFFGAWCF